MLNDSEVPFLELFNYTKFCLNDYSTVNSEIFARIIFFANSFKRHFCDVKRSQLGHDLSISVNDSVISLFREGFIFMKLGICEVSRK